MRGHQLHFLPPQAAVAQGSVQPKPKQTSAKRIASWCTVHTTWLTFPPTLRSARRRHGLTCCTKQAPRRSRTTRSTSEGTARRGWKLGAISRTCRTLPVLGARAERPERESRACRGCMGCGGQEPCKNLVAGAPALRWRARGRQLAQGPVLRAQGAAGPSHEMKSLQTTAQPDGLRVGRSKYDFCEASSRAHVPTCWSLHQGLRL